MFIFASHNVLTQSDSPLGYRLLRCIRTYLDLTMWESLEVHTAETIAAGRQAVIHLRNLIEVCYPYCYCQSTANWVFYKEYNNELNDAERYENFDFPKLHAQQHVFDDIEAKGVLRNYTTRLFERLHGPFKTWYERRTNFKNVAPQVSQSYAVTYVIFTNILGQLLQNAHFSLASIVIRHQIDSLKVSDDENSDDLDALNDDIPHINPDSPKPTFFGNVYLGAPQKQCSFDAIQIAHADDSAFHQFRARFAKTLNGLLHRDDSPVQLLNNSQVSVADEDFVSLILIFKHDCLLWSYS
jgi:hypothetical protein